MAKKIIKIVLLLGALAFGLTIIFFMPIDRGPLQEKEFYSSMMLKLDTLSIEKHVSSTFLRAGWGRENITPNFIAPMAGYSPRDQFEEVHDSLFVNVIVLDNGNVKVAFISFDLLIVPPLLEEKLEMFKKDQIPEVDFLYLSASHTHNGIGGWDNSLGGQLISGNFNDEILDHLESKTFDAIKKAIENLKESKIDYFEVSANKYVQNRLDPESEEDGTIRGIELVNNNGKRAILVTFSAHSTNIPSSSLSISGDYPGQLTRNLEKSGYDFAMFMAGAMGSHKIGRAHV